MKAKQFLRFAIVLFAILAVNHSMWAKTSTLTFTAACGGSGTADDNAEWTVTSDGAESTFDNTSGIHYGTKNASVTYVQLSTSDIDGTITQVVVNCRDAQAKATVSVTVGGTAFTCSGSATATNSSADYTFTGSGSGEVVVKVDRGSLMTKAIYVKSVVVTYTALSITYTALSINYNVTLNRNGVKETINNVTSGTALDDIDGTGTQGGCSAWTFIGWSKTQRAAQNSTAAMTLVTEVDGAGPYYAVYRHTESGGGNSEITFTPGTDTGETSVTKSDITCTLTTMNNASYYQIYANQPGTFSCSSGNITQISFTCTASGTSKYGPGNASANVGSYSYSGSTGTWTGEASSVTISSTAQIRMSSLSVTYSGGDTYYYSTTASCCQNLGTINGSVK